jgi:hypothetical protein
VSVERLYDSWQAGLSSENHALRDRVHELEQQQAQQARRIIRAEQARQAKARHRRLDEQLRKLHIGDPVWKREETIRKLDSMRRIPRI